MYQICLTVDADETLDPPWVTIRVVEGGAHRGGMTQRKEDFIPPWEIRELSELVAYLEASVLAHLSTIAGVQLSL
jgi:hypothetical protein